MSEANDAEIRALEHYLHQQIPLTVPIGVGVRRIDERGILLSAPLAPNINHLQTAFGGSTAALATLACWSLVHLRLQKLSSASTIVVRRTAMDYLHPIDRDFEAFCPSPNAEIWTRFTAELTHRGKARIQLDAELCCDEVRAAEFQGTFIAIHQER